MNWSDWGFLLLSCILVASAVWLTAGTLFITESSGSAATLTQNQHIASNRISSLDGLNALFGETGDVSEESASLKQTTAIWISDRYGIELKG
ncbi:hypothetical protein JW979_00015, partial [bacterium]|nr:hypothetical protein [candidate division CSSED10-310 bacterium]